MAQKALKGRTDTLGYNVLISHTPTPLFAEDVQWLFDGDGAATVFATTTEAIQEALKRVQIDHAWVVPFDDQRSLEDQCTPDRKIPKIVYNPPGQEKPKTDRVPEETSYWVYDSLYGEIFGYTDVRRPSTFHILWGSHKVSPGNPWPGPMHVADLARLKPATEEDFSRFRVQPPKGLF